MGSATNRGQPSVTGKRPDQPKKSSKKLKHNDTKASNFLWDSIDDSLTVIDLDAMQMPKSRRDQLSGQRRDRRRLLRNFAATPELQRRFRGALGL